MQLTPQAIQEFRKIYRDELGEELTGEEAVELATSFANLMRVVFRPLPPEAVDDSSIRDVLY